LETREISVRKLGSLKKLDDFISSKLNPDIKVSATPEQNNNDYKQIPTPKEIKRDCTELEETLSVQHSFDKEIQQKFQYPKDKHDITDMSIEGNSITLNIGFKKRRSPVTGATEEHSSCSPLKL